ncbi:MAG: hypothetical protein J1F63_04390 [Oscillospiraceae bacterium]|nr:hypothetical protein [Oscillospiraceae bacterium]
MKKSISLLLAVAMLLAVVPGVTVLAATESEAAIFTDESAWLKETEQRRAEMEQLRAEEEARRKEIEAESAKRRMALDISEDGVHPSRPAEPTTVQDGAALMSTDGTYSEVVYIETVEDLLAIDGHENGYYELMNDLNISGIEWKPLCLPGGVFNGNGHTVSGMTITEVPENSEGDIGLFGFNFYLRKNVYVYDLNLVNFDINISIDSDRDSPSWPTYISAMGFAYCDTCNMKGSINVDEKGINNELHEDIFIAGISDGTDCFSDIDINLTTDVEMGAEYYGMVNVYGLLNCINSISNGDITINMNSVDPWSIRTYGISNCVNCKMYGDINAFGNKEITAVSNSENCAYYGDIKTLNTEYTYGIYYSEGCTFVGCIESAATSNTEGSEAGNIYVMSYSTDCTVQGDMTATGSCTIIADGTNCAVYGEISSGSVSGLSNCTDCIVYGDITSATGTLISLGSDNYIKGNVNITAGGALIIDISSGNYIDGNITVTNGNLLGIIDSSDNYINGNITVNYGQAVGIQHGNNNYINGNLKVSIGTGELTYMYVSVLGIASGSGNYISGVVQGTYAGYIGTATHSVKHAVLLKCDHCGQFFGVCESNYCDRDHVHCVDRYRNPYDIMLYPLALYSGSIWGDDDPSGSYPGSGSEPEEPTPPAPKATYTLKIIDILTDTPLAGAVVTVDAKEYTTNANGVVTLSNAPITGGLRVEHGGSVVIAKSNFKAIPNQVNTVYANGLDIGPEDFFAGNGGSALIKGPQAEVFNKKINLFELPFNFDLNFWKHINIAYDKDRKVYQIISSLSMDDINNDDYDNYYDEIIRDASDKSWIDNFHKIQFEFELAKNQNWNYEFDIERVPGKLGPDGKVSAALFLELQPDGNQLKLVSGGAYVKFEGEYKGGAPILSMPILYLAYGVSGELMGNMNLELEKATLVDPQINAVADITAELTPYIGAGIGTQDILSIEAGLKGKLGMGLKVPAEKLSDSLTIDFTGQVYILGTALWLKTEYVKDFMKWQLYPYHGVEFMSLQDESDYSIIDRSYLNAAMPMALSAGTVKNGIYPYGGVKTGVLSDGRVIMVWLDDDTSRNLVNKTALYYSILENGVWSAPAQIENDGTADFDFDLKVSGNKAALVWQDALAALEESASLEDASAAIELSYAEFDGAKWSVPVAVTSGNTDYEYSPKLYYDGNAYIAWKQNSENSALPDTDIESIYSTAVSGGKVSEVKPEYEDMPLIYGLAVGKGGSVAIITDDASASGRVLYVDGTENYKSASRLSGLCYDNGFCFTENGTVQKAQSYGSYPKTLFEGGNAEKIAYITGHGHQAAVYEVQNEYTSNLYASYYEEGGWTNPVPITDFKEKIRSWDAHIDEKGNIIIGAVLANIVIENETMNDTARLVYTTTEPIEDIAVNTVTVKGDVTPGKMAEFIVNVTNNTKNDITSIDIALNGRDAQLYSGVQTVNIPAGASAYVTVNVMIPNDFDAQTITADITAPNLTESNKSNNTASGDFGAGNLKVELKGNSIMSDGTAQAVIKNTGCADVTDVILTVTGENGENIYTGEIGTVTGGETKKIRFTLDSSYYTFDGDNDSFAITATVDGNGDTLQFDNESTYCISWQSAEIISFAQPQAVMRVGDVYSPQVNVYPKNTSAEIYLVSDNESVAVIENGVITAVSNGTATITAMASGMAMTAKMTIYVRDLSAPVITSAEYYEFSDISGTYGDVYVSVDLTGCFEDGEAERMIIAVYAEDDELIGIATNDVTARRYDGINISTRNKKPKYVKAFIWNRLAGMMPAAYAASREITEIN